MKSSLYELRSIIRGIILEKSMFATKTSVQSKILSASEELFGKGVLNPGSGRSGEIRLQPKDRNTKFSTDDIKNLLSAAGYSVSKIVKPGEPGSMSSKFDTYLNDSGYALTIAGGGTRGQEFEKKIQTSTIDSGDLKSLIDGLEQSMGFKLNVISHRAGPSHVKRPIGLMPENVGEKIADLVLTTPDGDVYVSLKDPSGSTFGNFGIVGAFSQNENGKVISKNHPSDNILEILGVNKDLIARGLNSFISKKPVEKPMQSVDFNQDAVANLIQSGYGYGYWYARKTSDGWKIVDLTTPKKLEKHVGKVSEVVVKYPNTDSKQCSIWVQTSKNDVYKFEIRNAKGGILPTELKVKVQKSYREI